MTDYWKAYSEIIPQRMHFNQRQKLTQLYDITAY